MDPGVMAMLQKSISAKLCPTVLGQACMDLVVNPPRPGEPSYDSWLAEKNLTLSSLARRAKLVAETLNTIPGFSCNTVQGAMYAFPQIILPEKVAALFQSKLSCEVLLCCRQSRPLRRRARRPMSSTPSTCWRRRGSVSSRALALVRCHALSTSEQQSCLRWRFIWRI